MSAPVRANSNVACVVKLLSITINRSSRRLARASIVDTDRAASRAREAEKSTAETEPRARHGFATTPTRYSSTMSNTLDGCCGPLNPTVASFPAFFAMASVPPGCSST